MMTQAGANLQLGELDKSSDTEALCGCVQERQHCVINPSTVRSVFGL